MDVAIVYKEKQSKNISYGEMERRKSMLSPEEKRELKDLIIAIDKYELFGGRDVFRRKRLEKQAAPEELEEIYSQTDKNL